MLLRYELENPLGFYTPSFFRIHINTDENLIGFNSYSQVTSAAFIHEYVHYLQDLTTCYGLMNIIYIVEFIQSVNFNQRASSTRELKIPYALSPAKDGKVFYNSALTKLYSGTMTNIGAKKMDQLDIETKVVYLPTVSGGTIDKEVKLVKLKGIRHDNSPVEYYIGSHSIMETMAYEIEILTQGKIIADPPSLPYRGARFLADIIYPHFSDNPLNLIALCDWSLMYFNPAIVFAEGLKLMLDENYYPDKPADIYAYLGQQVKFDYENTHNYQELFEYLSHLACETLKGYFTTPLHEENRVWIDDIFKKSKTIRKDFPDFMVQLASGGPIQTNGTFRFLIDRIGTPIVTNNENKAMIRIDKTINQQQIEPEMFWAISQIYNVYVNSPKSRKTRCDMIEWCKDSCTANNIPDYTDERCQTAPWTKIADNSTCAFCAIWRIWQMDSEYPTG